MKALHVSEKLMPRPHNEQWKFYSAHRSFLKDALIYLFKGKGDFKVEINWDSEPQHNKPWCF